VIKGPVECDRVWPESTFGPRQRSNHINAYRNGQEKTGATKKPRGGGGGLAPRLLLKSLSFPPGGNSLYWNLVLVSSSPEGELAVPWNDSNSLVSKRNIFYGGKQGEKGRHIADRGRQEAIPHEICGVIPFNGALVREQLEGGPAKGRLAEEASRKTNNGTAGDLQLCGARKRVKNGEVFQEKNMGGGEKPIRKS